MATDIVESDLVVVVGGDGTVRKLLRALSRAQTPLYVVPGGNESLIARSYNMSANVDDLLQAIIFGKCQEQYFGSISGIDLISWRLNGQSSPLLLKGINPDKYFSI